MQISGLSNSFLAQRGRAADGVDSPAAGLPLMRAGALRATISPVAATILIVDDHAGFRSYARALLVAEGFDVVGDGL